MASELSISSVGSRLTQVKMPASWKACSAAMRSPGNGALRSHFLEKRSSRLVSVEAKASRWGRQVEVAKRPRAALGERAEAEPVFDQRLQDLARQRGVILFQLVEKALARHGAGVKFGAAHAQDAGNVAIGAFMAAA